jgi:prevent-host-death family protein
VKELAAFAGIDHRDGYWIQALILDQSGPLKYFQIDQNFGLGERSGTMSKILPISEVKTRLPELVSGVAEREEEIVVTRNGKPAAVLVNYDEYERLKDTLDVLSDPVLMKQIAQSKSFYTRGRQGQSFEAVFGESLVVRKRRKR